ncbi:lipopolysaccharide biosynthesis protein [Caballeronia sp. LZ001]|uniref:lipopolysaccharide biosynthesis protein n=1 Tax=Caballeronia sp. LZ001 TaxID=3038553 RepID=UPI002862C74D|nr:lipopolysaccharide biosynthesis protein [Caballeronia sp. LZ001]MDR5800122.1 lipopolysaccharide biosynthesis protein [Caballeronia sp. LZ001]
MNENQSSHFLKVLSKTKAAALATALVASTLLAACGGGGESAVDAAVDKSAATPQSTEKAATTSSIFYGANGHITNGGAYDTTSYATQLSQLQNLGVKIYRNDVYSQASARVLATVAKQFAAGGVQVYPVMLLGLNYNSEQAAYNAGYTMGQQTAQTYNYTYYEVGNELEANTLSGNYDGNVWNHYSNQPFTVARGLIRGMIAGVKSVNSSAKIIVDGTWKHTAFFQMLADGSQPDGTHGHPTVSWDITAWHWYSDQGDMTHACGNTGCHDILGVLNSFGKPVWINEYGVRPTYGTYSAIASYFTGSLMMQQFYNNAAKYNIQSIQAFEMYDDSEGAYGLMTSDGKTQKPAFTAVKSFIASHPK